MSRSTKWDIEPVVLSPDTIAEGLELCGKATQVNQWVDHGPERDPECTVRGPFGRWFKVDEVPASYSDYCGSAREDAAFCAHALTNYRDALAMVLSLQDEVENLKGSQDITRFTEEFSKE